MTRKVEAIYENGVFRPLEAVDLPAKERVTLILAQPLGDYADLVDTEFMQQCALDADDSVTLEEVRNALAGIPGNLADDIAIERRDG